MLKLPYALVILLMLALQTMRTCPKHLGEIINFCDEKMENKVLIVVALIVIVFVVVVFLLCFGRGTESKKNTQRKDLVGGLIDDGPVTFDVFLEVPSDVPQTCRLFYTKQDQDKGKSSVKLDRFARKIDIGFWEYPQVESAWINAQDLPVDGALALRVSDNNKNRSDDLDFKFQIEDGEDFQSTSDGTVNVSVKQLRGKRFYLYYP